MRILMTADTLGGVWTHAIELSRALREHDIEVALATFGAPPTREQRHDAARCGNVELHVSTLALEWMEDPWDDVDSAGDLLLELEERLRVDVVHVNGLCHGSLPFHAPVLAVGHSCVLSWWEAVRGGSPPPELDEYRRRAREGLQGAALVAAPSRTMLAALQRHYGPLPRTRAILDGIRLRTSDDPKEPFVLCAGRLWDEAKDVGTLARAARAIRWPVYVAGDARGPSGGSARIDGVRALGRLDSARLEDWFARAAIYALPARYEPFGQTPVEAALTGAALVLGDIPSLREVWGDAALYHAPGDAEGLAQAVNSLASDETLRKRCSRAALRRAAAYSAERMACEYADVYASLARRGRASRVHAEPTLAVGTAR
jgi:glycogen(starch) synthase